MAAAFRDADGITPRHTFFYPAEAYHPGFVTPLAQLTQQGFAEVEIHLHHRGDTADTLRDKLVTFRDLLRNEHGLLADQADQADQTAASDRITRSTESRRSTDFDDFDDFDDFATSRKNTTIHEQQATNDEQRATKNEQPHYAFIHGNWALCNSHPDGDWCGVNEELSVLRGTGCYADFTFPSAPSPTQPRMVNALYYAQDTPGRPRGHDSGLEASTIPLGTHPSAFSLDNLLLVTGPLALNWSWRKWGILPRIEHADLCGSNPPTPRRADLWIRQHIHVRGRPDWVFVKLHTHGCIEANSDVLLGRPMQDLHTYLTTRCNDGTDYALHYVTAREMTNIIHAAEAGMKGDPGQYRDFAYSPPPLVRPCP